MKPDTFIYSGQPYQDSAAFRVCVKRAARLWEAGNNSGDPAVLEENTAKAEAYQAKAEEIARAYGLKVTWPGLYPVLTDASGRSWYDMEEA